MAKAGDGAKRSDKRRTEKRLAKRVTAAQFQAFTERAHAAGFSSAGELLAALIAGPSELDRAFRKDVIRCIGSLGKIGSNVNQIAHKLNSRKGTDLSPSDIVLMQELKGVIGSAVDEIMAALK